MALTAGSSMSEHENPGEATVQVLGGRVRLVADAVSWEGRDGDLLFVPQARHTLHALGTPPYCSRWPNCPRRGSSRSARRYLGGVAANSHPVVCSPTRSVPRGVGFS
jgi:hypothetical protein